MRSAISLAALGVMAVAGQARAAVIVADTAVLPPVSLTETTILPTDHFTAPVSTTGKVVEVEGTAQHYKSPFSDKTSKYLAVEFGSATYLAPGLTHELSLVWGTPDKYNTIDFYNGNTLVDSYTGSFVKGKVQYGYFTTLRTTEAFDKVTFASTDWSFELSNVAFSTVPLPAAAPLFGAALLALAGLGYGINRRGEATAKQGASA